MKQVMVIGAGPAGLMAAEIIQAAGHQVHVYDAMPSACRKFLLAGVGGMNITHSEPYNQFITRYYDKQSWLEPSVRAFNADSLRSWIHELGIETFVGTSGRVFPKEMKAAPLLRHWLKRLKDQGVQFHMRHRLIALNGLQATFANSDGTVSLKADAVVLALGGASWPKLGSDGNWVEILRNLSIDVAPLESTNCGFISKWSQHLSSKHAGAPLKNVSFTMVLATGESLTKKGECIVTQDGMEGSLVYAFSKYFRDALHAQGYAECQINLVPDLDNDQLLTKLQRTKAKESFSTYLKRTLKLDAIKIALLHECFSKEQLQTPEQIATCLQFVPVRFFETKPIDEVISSAGGVCEHSVDEYFMLKQAHGVFCAGEMLDWEAPTGGYLLTACFATGRQAGLGVTQFLAR